MKIGILTYYYAYNFGAMMQAYALRKAISSVINADDSVELINYCPKTFHNFGEDYNNPQYVTYAEKMETFIKDYCLVSKDAINDKYHLDEYDAYIVGSDQVWNPKLPVLEETAEYFLDFVSDKKKKIAYAPSIGECIDDEFDTNLFERFIPRFDFLSVRERSHINFIEKFTDKKCHHVLDPVFLLNQDDYENMLPPLKKEAPYVLCVVYNQRLKDRAYDLVNRYSIINNMQVVHYEKNIKPYIFRNKDKSLAYSGEQELLWNIKNADIVITDSFHFFAFSVMFHKPVFIYPEFRSVRLLDLASMLGLEGQVISERTKPNDLSNQHIDYIYVDNILKEKREDSFRFIKESLYS